MTKKFITSLNKKNKATRTSEFVIPDILEKSNFFLGIKTGKKYSSGIVCFTGVDLTVDNIIDVLLQNRIIKNPSNKHRKIINQYLNDITKFKISNCLNINREDESFKLVKADFKIEIEKPRLP